MIVVTAPTGAIGRQVLDRLLSAGRTVRVIARDPSRLPGGTRERAEVVPGSHGDPAVVDRAFEGADAVFWLVPPDPRAADPDDAYSGFSRPACDALVRHGVGHVVGISALGRGFAGRAGLVTASLAMDDLMAGTGVPHRALTMPAFMENMLTHAGSIRERGVFSSPVAPGLALPVVATRDIAAVAVRWLLDRSWRGRADVPVLGPEDLSFDAVARITAEVAGVPVRYEQVPAGEFAAAMAGAGMSEAMARGTAEMLSAKNEGLDTLEPRTARSATPTSYRTWCEEVLKPVLLA
ncbi:NAD(P)H-binding protein [Actinocorallia longicatena]|uniref:NAD(P)H-binding protein n=1 Tax=Actinocorallia longicatena TaxID=111803 RepID=A0ABP6PVD6_9ACTN